MIPTDRLDTEIDAPQIVEIPPKAKSLEIDVRVSLTNPSEDDYVVHGLSDEDRLFWHVFDENQREVLREAQPRGRRRAPRIDEARSQLVAGGHSIHETATLKLDTSKLKDGTTYTIRSRFWGQQAEAKFVAVYKPEIMKKKAAPKKASDEKKSTAKGSAKKKTKKASKKTTKKGAKK